MNELVLHRHSSKYLCAKASLHVGVNSGCSRYVSVGEFGWRCDIEFINVLSKSFRV